MTSLRLCDLAADTGATLRLIGDPAQHGSVPAGGSFTELVDTFDTRTPQLATVRRLTDAGERRRADLVRNGRIDEALDELEASGQLVLTDSEHAHTRRDVARWYERTRSRTIASDGPRTQPSNDAVLNALAQQILIADGDVDARTARSLADGRRLCVGDQVVARHGDRSIHPVADRNGWMRNGTTGQIVDIRASKNTPRGDEIDIATADGTITCTRPTFDRSDGGIDLAYAVTSYAVQGATHDVSTSAITAVDEPQRAVRRHHPRSTQQPALRHPTRHQRCRRRHYAPTHSRPSWSPSFATDSHDPTAEPL